MTDNFRKIWGVSLSILAFSLNTSTVSAQSCGIQPTCESLGYTKSVQQCEGVTALKCPFDETKVYCQELCDKYSYFDSQSKKCRCNIDLPEENHAYFIHATNGLYPTGATLPDGVCPMAIVSCGFADDGTPLMFDTSCACCNWPDDSKKSCQTTLPEYDPTKYLLTNKGVKPTNATLSEGECITKVMTCEARDGEQLVFDTSCNCCNWK